MAKEKVQVEYSLKDNASKGLSKISGKMIGVVAGLTALTVGIKKSVKAYGVQETAIASMEQALKNQGNFTQEASNDLQNHASALQKVTTFGDESIIAMQSQFAQMGLNADQIKEISEVTLDLAVAQGMDLASAGKLVAKSVGSSTNALSRYGVEVKGAVGSTERLDSAVTNLSTVFGGQARADADTYAGAIKQMQNAWGDVGEQLGKVFVPVIISVSKWLTKVAENKAIPEFFAQLQIGTAKNVEQWQLLVLGFENGLETIKAKIVAIGGFMGAMKEGIAGVQEFLIEQDAIDLERITEQEAQKQLIIDASLAKQLEINGALVKGNDKKNKAIVKSEILTADQLKKIDADRAKAFDSTLGFMAKGMQSKNKQIFEIGKASAVANATMDTYSAFNKALASAPPPINFVLAGATLAVGLDQVSQINSTQFQAQEGAIVEPTDGGSSVTVGEAGGAEAIVPLDEGLDGGLGTPNVTVNIDGRQMAQEFYEINTEQLSTGELQGRG